MLSCRLAKSEWNISIREIKSPRKMLDLGSELGVWLQYTWLTKCFYIFILIHTHVEVSVLSLVIFESFGLLKGTSHNTVKFQHFKTVFFKVCFDQTLQYFYFKRKYNCVHVFLSGSNLALHKKCKWLEWTFKLTSK